MDVGQPQRTIVVEPIEHPVPAGERETAPGAPGVPDVIDPISGWRLWTVVRVRDGGLRLSSVTRDTVWPAGRSLDAHCVERHEAPHPACACGVHALRGPEGLFRCLGA